MNDKILLFTCLFSNVSFYRFIQKRKNLFSRLNFPFPILTNKNIKRILLIYNIIR